MISLIMLYKDKTKRSQNALKNITKKDVRKILECVMIGLIELFVFIIASGLFILSLVPILHRYDVSPDTIILGLQLSELAYIVFMLVTYFYLRKKVHK